MKTVHFGNLIALLMVLFVSACSNPAGDVTPAAVSDAPAGGNEVMHGTKYAIAETSTISFVGSKVTGSHDGGFKKFEGELYVVGDAITTAKGKVVIDMKSVWSDNNRLTGHLMTGDFFEVEKYPTATFTCSSVKMNGEQTTISGTLDLHGVTKAVEFPATIAKAGDEFTLKAEFKIKRFDWGIVYKGQADNLIYDDVVLKLDLKAAKA